jgi:hypothetical protein
MERRRYAATDGIAAVALFFLPAISFQTLYCLIASFVADDGSDIAWS